MYQLEQNLKVKYLGPAPSKGLNIGSIYEGSPKYMLIF